MTHLKRICILFFFGYLTCFSQDKIVKHTVAQGETITQISEKYSVSANDILKLNPDVQAGLKPNMILLIHQNSLSKPQKTSSTTEKSAVNSHLIATGETVFALAKMYNTTVEAIQKANPNIEKEGLKIGEYIIVPATLAIKNSASPIEKKTENKPQIIGTKESKQIVYHQVEAKETKFSIAKQYNISITELEDANPEIKTGLQVGFRLKIIENLSLRKEEPKELEKTEPVKKILEAKKAAYLEHIVKSKETIFSLTKKFGIDQELLFNLNPELKNGLEIGMVLKFPADAIITEKKEKTNNNLNNSIKKDSNKKLLLLLPFNISKIENDTVNTVASKLKSDKFLNMTLDFYAGALVAIDSAKTLGLNIDVNVIDSEETKNSSNILNLIKENRFDDAAVVIGPFYQSNVDKTAELLIKNKTIIISPLSKESSKSYSNLVLATPNPALLKTAIFDYMRSKNGSIVAIIDPKKVASKQYLTQKQKDVKFIGADQKLGFISDSIVKRLVKNKINYVILDSEKTGTILKTLNILIGLLPTYQIQLVILEKNETLDFEEIPLDKLAKLKMLYPSVIKENISAEGLLFEKDFKIANKIYPNQFATRGFDLTFDTLIRLSQEKSFSETLESSNTEQVENKFDYQKKENGTYVNNGVYILYYDSDLSVKIAQ